MALVILHSVVGFDRLFHHLVKGCHGDVVCDSIAQWSRLCWTQSSGKISGAGFVARQQKTAADSSWAAQSKDRGDKEQTGKGFCRTGSHGSRESSRPLQPCRLYWNDFPVQRSPYHGLTDLHWQTGPWRLQRMTVIVSVFNLPKESKTQSFSNITVMDTWKRLCKGIG